MNNINNSNEFLLNNVVYLRGRISKPPIYSHHVFGEGFYETVLEIGRLSEQTDMVPITVSDRLMEENALKEGQEISVTGQFRSYNKIVDGRSKLMLTVFVREFVKEDNEFTANQVDLTGYVCKEPIFRTTPFKREIADLLIAVNRTYGKSDYIPCIAWGRNAKYAKGLAVGTRIKLSGRIQSRTYQKVLEDGLTEMRTAYEVSVSRIEEAAE